MARRKDDGGVVAAECACAIGDHVGRGGRAVAVAPQAKAANLKRLRRIEGQVRGLQRMVEEDRYCADVLTQIASVHEALRGVGRELMRNHLKHCASTAIRAGGKDADKMYEELLDVMYRQIR
jgi:CsoR family transcriptional regulator, copper-sensing transcriptional repressor